MRDYIVKVRLIRNAEFLVRSKNASTAQIKVKMSFEEALKHNVNTNGFFNDEKILYRVVLPRKRINKNEEE